MKENTDYRFGGRPPQTKTVIDFERFGYLGTFPSPDFCETVLSIFVTTDLDYLFQCERKLLQGGAVIVEFHQPTEQLKIAVENPFFKNPYSLTISKDLPDTEVFSDEEYEIASGNKIFGSPAFINENGYEEYGIGDIEKGFEFFLQLDVPEYGDAHLREQWPFPNGPFFLFVKKNLQKYEYYWIWECD